MLSSNFHESLLCHEVLDSFPHYEESSIHLNCTNLDCSRNQTVAAISSTACGFSDLDNILIDTPPDFQLSVRFKVIAFMILKNRYSYIFLVMQDLQFGSQESIMSWLDRF